MKEQYAQAIKTIILNFSADMGEEASLAAAETILDSGLDHIRNFTEHPGSETIEKTIIELGTADTPINKIIAFMSLAFALGTMKVETDITIQFFNDLLSLLFTEDFTEITAMRTMVASMYETASHNSPF